MKQLERIFQYEEKNVRTIFKDEEIWFVARDVCEVLDIKQTVRAIERLDIDEVNSIHVIDSIGRNQETYIINEPGLYTLILGSRKPEAKAFKRWITHEVIPSIRKTGTYMIQQQSEVQALPVKKSNQKNTNIREAKKLFAILREEIDVLTPEAHQAILSHATELLTGKALNQTNDSLQLPEPKTQHDKSFVNKQFILTIINFCKQFGIQPPSSNNYDEWWEEAIYQLDEKQIDRILQNQSLKTSKHWMLRSMYDKIEQRKNGLSSMH